MVALLEDLRSAIRGLRLRPGYALVVIATLALPLSILGAIVGLAALAAIASSRAKAPSSASPTRSSSSARAKGDQHNPLSVTPWASTIGCLVSV